MAIIAFGQEPQAGMSTTTKYALGAAAVAAVGVAAWWMMKKPAGLKANKRKAKRVYKSLCPVCGERSIKVGVTKDGRVIRSCGDATREKPVGLKANKRKRSRKCPVCAATPKKSSTRCHRCGHSYGMRANGIKRYTRKHKGSKGTRGMRSVELLAMHRGSFVARPVKGKKRGHAHTYSKRAYKLLGHGMRSNPPYGVYEVSEHRVGGDRDLAAAVRMARGLAHSRAHDKTVVYDEGRKNRGPKGEFVAMFRPNAKTKRASGWQKKLYKGPATKWRYTALKKYRKYGATERSHYAFPEAFKYPIHGKDVATTKRFIRTAASRFAKFKMRIAPEYREAVGRRIEAAKKKYGIGEYNPKYARKGKKAAKRKVA